jgi:hypothetical protein
MKITKKELKVFQNIVDEYINITEIPKPNNWKKLDNNMLWLKIVGQINVVGGVKGNDRFWQRNDLIDIINYEKLRDKKTDDEIAKNINYVLREAGVRYSSINIEKCSKTKSLLYNFKIIRSHKNGMIEILQNLSKIKGEGAELERVMFFVRNFMFIKNKSARDLLMTLGINRNTLALDIRIQNIFKEFGIEFPNQVGLSNWKTYTETEVEIIEKICLPLEIEPIIFDRILFQNYEKILKKK